MMKQMRSVSCAAAGVLGLMLSLGLGGCDQSAAKDQAAVESMQQELDELKDGFNQDAQAQLDQDGFYEADPDYIENVASTLENAANSTSSEQSKVLQKQANLLRELKTLMEPYDTALAEFADLGGLEVSTLTDPSQFARRIELIAQLVVANESMDAKFPRVIRQLGKIEGLSPISTEKQVTLLSEIRQSDRVLFEAMNRYLQILHTHWNQYEEEAMTGTIIFSEDVPDSVVDEMGDVLVTIDTEAVRQGELQQALLNIDQP